MRELISEKMYCYRKKKQIYVNILFSLFHFFKKFI